MRCRIADLGRTGVDDMLRLAEKVSLGDRRQLRRSAQRLAVLPRRQALPALESMEEV